MNSVSHGSSSGLPDTRLGATSVSATANSNGTRTMTVAEQAARDIARVATFACDSPVAALVMPGVDVTWQRSPGQVVSGAGPHSVLFVDRAPGRDGLIEVPDVAQDERLSHRGTLVAGRAVVSFAGAPVIAANGRVLGTLMVIDSVPRHLSDAQRGALLALAALTATHLAPREEPNAAHDLVESAPVAIYRTDMRGKVTYANPEYLRLCSLAPEQSLADWANGVHPEDRPRMEAAWADFCRNPRPVTFEWRSAPAGGASRVLAEQVVAASRVAGFVGAITDITERVAARESLQRAETLFQNTIEQAPIGVAYAGRDGRFLRCNEAFCRLLGFSPRELESKTIDELTYAEDAARTSPELARLWRGEVDVVDVEKRYLCKDGRPLWVRVTSALIRDGGARPDRAVEFLRDISARKEMADALAENRALLAAVLADVPVAIVACDASGHIILHNRVADELFAMDPADISSSHAPTPYPESVDVFLPDGVTRVPREARPLARAVGGENVTNSEFVLKRADDMPRTTLNSARQLVGPDGECLGAVIVTQDVTHLKSLERDLAQAQKLESIGQLSAGIAHEINTPTQFIGDNIRFLQDSFQEVLGLVVRLSTLVAAHRGGAVPADPIAKVLERADVSYLRDEIPKAIAQSLEGVERIAKIVGAMKEFSHPGVEKTPVDLNRAIASTITVATNEWKYVADVTTDFDQSLPAVPVMPGAFNQVILNILVNAAHAIDSAAKGVARNRGAIAVGTRRDGDWVEICIADSGCGIPPHAIKKIFDPFFTTKPVGKGTGQGLAIAHDVVVKKHGGTISVESEQGVGTTFTVRLPLQATDTEATTAA
jgi:two-component system, NtrC family, sensor kinase